MLTISDCKSALIGDFVEHLYNGRRGEITLKDDFGIRVHWPEGSSFLDYSEIEFSHIAGWDTLQLCKKATE